MGRIFILFLLLSFHGCVSVDPASVKPTVGGPISAQIEPVKISRNTAMPDVLLVVDTVNVADSRTGIETRGDMGHGAIELSYFTDDKEQAKIKAQLISALSGIENFRVLDGRDIQKDTTGLYKINSSDFNTAKGPYIVRALITEYNARAEETGNKINVFPFAKKKHVEMKGFVALDIRVLSERTKENLTSFTSRGTFSTIDERASQGFILPLAQQHAFARSVADQAMRVALNDAAKQIYAKFEGSNAF